jgi:hypothetical protein
MRAAREAAHKKVKAALTPAQVKKLDALLAPPKKKCK